MAYYWKKTHADGYITLYFLNKHQNVAFLIIVIKMLHVMIISETFLFIFYFIQLLDKALKLAVSIV